MEPVGVISERSARFRLQASPAGPALFYRPSSRLIRDLGVLALVVLGVPTPQVLDAMSGSGVRALRYALEGGASFVQANDLMEGDHPLEVNLADLVADGRCNVSNSNALDLYLRSRLDGTRYDLVDVDAFGTGQPHLSEGWFAVNAGGLLYICATDSLTTAGANPHKAWSGYAATTQYFPACNEQGLRLVLATAFREAAARNLHAAPVFSYFDRPSSSFRVMMRLVKTRRPPAAAFEQLGYVARCPECGELWRVRADELGEAAAHRRCAHMAHPPKISGPLWVGPMHDAAYVASMEAEARARGWDDAVALLGRMAAEAEAEAGGALLFYHLGEVERVVAAAGLRQPSLVRLVEWLRAAGFAASPSHMESKALKTTASLAEIVQTVARAAAYQAEAEGAPPAARGQREAGRAAVAHAPDAEQWDLELAAEIAQPDRAAEMDERETLARLVSAKIARQPPP